MHTSGRLAKSLLGFTLAGAHRHLELAWRRTQTWGPAMIREINRAKQAWIKSAGALEFVPLQADMDQVGGLANLKAWLDRRRHFFSEAAEGYGLSKPRGIVLYGIPGCGKSLSAKAVAAQWNLPLVRMDLSRIFGIGQ